MIVPFAQTEPPFWRTNLYAHQTLFSLFHMTPANLRAYADGIHASNARYVEGYPSAIHLVARALLEEGRPLPRGKLAAVFTSSETLLAFQRATIEEAFQAPVRDRYGVSELGVSMTECAEGRLHVDMEFCIVEVEPIEETADSVTGPLLITGLSNPATPLLRYRIGDVGTRSKHPCPCGRAGDVFLEVDGRLEDYVLTPDGRWIGRLDHVFKEQVDVAEAQILQETPHAIEVLLVPRPELEQGERAPADEGVPRAARRRDRRAARDGERDPARAERQVPRGEVARREAAAVIRVGLARTEPSYAGIRPPCGPGKAWPGARAAARRRRRRGPRESGLRRRARRAARARPRRGALRRAPTGTRSARWSRAAGAWC